ncbi:MAG: N-acetylglucosamine-6-phosphate deacetylase, partial [Actinomycetes bacterium]
MSTGLILRGRIVTGSMDVPDGVVAVDGGVITYAGPASGFSVADSDGAESAGHDVPGRILLPGLVDLHCHGALGSDFSEGSVNGARSAARYLHSRGTTTLLASLVTGSPEH